MIRRPTCAGRLNATEPKFSQIEGRNEGVNHANRIVICNPVIQAFRQQSRLPAISPLNEAPHAQPPPIQCGNHSRHGVFTQPGSAAEARLNALQESDLPHEAVIRAAPRAAPLKSPASVGEQDRADRGRIERPLPGSLWRACRDRCCGIRASPVRSASHRELAALEYRH